jgi:hypothetical protein
MAVLLGVLVFETPPRAPCVKLSNLALVGFCVFFEAGTLACIPTGTFVYTSRTGRTTKWT